MPTLVGKYERRAGNQAIFSSKKGEWRPMDIGAGAQSYFETATPGAYIQIDVDHNVILDARTPPPREGGGGGGNFASYAPSPSKPSAPSQDAWTPEKIKFQAFVNILAHRGDMDPPTAQRAVEFGWEAFHGGPKPPEALALPEPSIDPNVDIPWVITRYPDGTSSRQVAGGRKEVCQRALCAIIEHVEAADILGIREVWEGCNNDAERFWLYNNLSGRQKAVVDYANK